MDLLDPSKIKKDQSETAEQSKERTAKMSAEEARLARLINAKREEAEATIKGIDKDVAEYREKKEHEKKLLEQEVLKLEDRKRELLKPVDHLKAEAEQVLKNAKEYRASLDLEQLTIETESLKNKETAAALTLREQGLNDRETAIARKELGLSIAEGKLLEGANALKKAWEKHDLAAGELLLKTTAMAKRERQVEIREKAVEDRMKSLDEYEERLQSEDRRLQSERTAIAEAKRHLGLPA